MITKEQEANAARAALEVIREIRAEIVDDLDRLFHRMKVMEQILTDVEPMLRRVIADGEGLVY